MQKIDNMELFKNKIKFIDFKKIVMIEFEEDFNLSGKENKYYILFWYRSGEGFRFNISFDFRIELQEKLCNLFSGGVKVAE